MLDKLDDEQQLLLYSGNRLCPDKFYILEDSLYRHVGGNGATQSLSWRMQLATLAAFASAVDRPVLEVAAVKLPQAAPDTFTVTVQSQHGASINQVEAFSAMAVDELKQALEPITRE